MSNLILLLFILILVNFMLILNFFLAKKINKNLEKSSPFECGFDYMIESRLPFSLQFYLISLIFLIFDVEIAMILPMIFSTYYLKYYLFTNFLIIFLILLLGLYMEWFEGALKWIKYV